MRNTLLALLLLLGATCHSFAQTYRYYLYIPDNSIISSVTNALPASITPIFNDPNINAIISNYTITEFHKAFPTADQEYLRHCYKITCDDPALPGALRTYDAVLFPYYEEIPERQLLGTYAPNDSGLNYDADLWFVKANAAYFHSKGSSKVKIGVTDTYFNVNHPDMSGKYSNVRANTLSPADSAKGDGYHGTSVGGLIAAATHNSIGFPGMGFDCVLDVSSDWANDSVVLAMSKDTIKVINCSWQIGSSSTLNPPFTQQGIYNEIYENGTIAIFGAGNGVGTSTSANYFCYPASLDHNFSVSAVGWEGDSSVSLTGAKWVHELNAGDSVTDCYQHNTRVDLLAPAVRLYGHYYDPNNLSKHYETGFGLWGTSFAAPLVTGTCGLMLAVKPWLSPYQMEYVLKTTSTDVRNVSWNKRYNGPPGSTRHRGGRIGSGVLNAGAAVEMISPDDFNPYADSLTTFTIEGIDLNTRCRADIVNDKTRPLPRLKPVLKNGTPPYTYKWEPYPDNNSTLHVLSPLDSPQIATSSGTHLVHYRLTVYDNSPIQKVANKEIKIQLITDTNKWDLVMRDAYADMLNERNNMDVINAKDWDIWASPDIWCRQASDSLPAHQNPEYAHPDPAYIYTRIKNIGCKASPLPDSTMLNLYWTVASTGETWPIDWIGGSTIPPNNIRGGDTIVSNLGLPSIPPGDQILVETPWSYPPRPQDYDSTWTTLPVCLLARITHLGATNDGMTFVEDSVTKENVWNNNNIVTRNLIVTNLNAISPYNTPVWTGNSSNTPGTFTLQVITGQQIKPFVHGNPGSFLLGTLQLGDLYDIWVAGGRHGNVSNYEDDTKTVQFDLSEPLRLENLDYDGNEKHMIFLKLEWNGNPVPQGVTDDRIFIRQLIEHIDSVDNGDGTKFAMARDEVYGTVAFALNIEPTEETEGKPSAQAFEEVPAMFTGYPNPSHEYYTLLALGDETSLASLVIVDIAGRTVYSKKNISFEDYKYQIRTSALQPGIYFIKMVDKKGKQHSVKFLKAE
jgi:hypothetical protein